MADGVYVRVGGGRYAFAVHEVREVEDRPHLTPVPGAPDAVLGICNLRGAVLPVVRFDELLGQRSDGGRFIVVTAVDDLVAGVMVDEILGVDPLPGELEPEPTPGLRGRALVDGDLVGVVDTAAALKALTRVADG